MMTSNVLVGCPIYKAHEKWLEPFIRAHKEYDMHFIENTIDDDSLYDAMMNDSRITVEKHKWNPDTQWIPHMLGDCFDKLRQTAIDGGYSHWLWIGADIFLENGGSIEELVKLDKDAVGYPTNLYALKEKGPPSVYKDGWLKWNEEAQQYTTSKYSWDELDKREVFQCHGTIGYSLIKTDTLHDVCFAHPKTKWQKWGTDLMFLLDYADKGHEFWCDARHRATNDSENNEYIESLKGRFERGRQKACASGSNS